MIHYPVPPHLSGAYAERRLATRRFSRSRKKLAATVLSLPIGPHLSQEQARYVVRKCVVPCRLIKSRSLFRSQPETNMISMRE